MPPERGSWKLSIAMTTRISMLSSLVLVSCVIAGCAVGPEYRRPDVEVPERFGSAPATQPATQPVSLARWWTSFNDPLLTSLVERAIEGNLDVKLAEARVREARAARRAVAADYYPGVGANGSYRKSRTSENAFDFGGEPAGGGETPGGFGGFAPPGEVMDLYQVGFDASWEIDVFGGVRRSVQAAEADVGAAVENRRDALVTLLAEVARNYLELRGYQQQIEIARRNVRIQQDAAEVARAKARLAGGSELDVVRAMAQVNVTSAAIPQLEAFRDQAAHRLSILLGLPPQAITAEVLEVRGIPGGPPEVPPGLPSELLRRRADVRRAEQEVIAATARIGVAVADLYPRFALTGAFGFQSEKPRNLLDWPSRFWNIGPQVTWTVFDAGRIRANIEVQNAREEQAVIRYRQAVLGALADVEDALVAYSKEQARRRELVLAVENSRRSVELAQTLYQGGARDFLNVIDAQRSLLLAEDALVQSERATATNLVAVYKALGGGWE